VAKSTNVEVGIAWPGKLWRDSTTVVRIGIDPEVVPTLITVTGDGNADRVIGTDTTLTVPNPHVNVIAAVETVTVSNTTLELDELELPGAPHQKLRAIKRVSRRRQELKIEVEVYVIVEHTHIEVIETSQIGTRCATQSARTIKRAS
jgi:hypothetical protein